MFNIFEKILFLILVLAFSIKAEAQEDSTFQKYLDKNISTSSLQNNDLVFVKQVLSNQRITLQSTFGKKDTQKSLEDVYKQTTLLEKSIVHYVNMNHKVIVNEMDMQRTNVDSELLLARLVYIKSKTWCMEESLKNRVEELHQSSKSDELVNSDIVEVLTLTETVITNLEKAKQFDRMKYRYNQKFVIYNWELTAGRLKDNDSKIEAFDLEFKRKYRGMLVDLFTMIGVLAMF